MPAVMIKVKMRDAERSKMRSPSFLALVYSVDHRVIRLLQSMDLLILYIVLHLCVEPALKLT